jgi:hypothetical protein
LKFYVNSLNRSNCSNYGYSRLGAILKKKLL